MVGGEKAPTAVDFFWKMCFSSSICRFQQTNLCGGFIYVFPWHTLGHTQGIPQKNQLPLDLALNLRNQVVVSNVFFFNLGKWSNLNHIFWWPWNHQLATCCKWRFNRVFSGLVYFMSFLGKRRWYRWSNFEELASINNLSKADWTFESLKSGDIPKAT